MPIVDFLLFVVITYGSSISIYPSGKRKIWTNKKKEKKIKEIIENSSVLFKKKKLLFASVRNYFVWMDYRRVTGLSPLLPNKGMVNNRQ